MTSGDVPSDLSDEGQRTFQESEWRWQRIGRVMLLGMVVAGLAGLLGDGPLSSTHVSSSNGSAQVFFERFLHRSTPTNVRIRITEPDGNGRFQVGIGSELLHRIRILHITPEPESQIVGSTGVIYRFASAPQNSSTEVTILWESEQWGTLRGSFTFDDASQVHTTQFVYP